MKKLFSVFLICLILFSSVCFAYNDRYLPINGINDALTNNSGYISNMSELFSAACNYFENSNVHQNYIQRSDYSFIVVPSFSNDHIRFYYFGVMNNDEIVFTGQTNNINNIGFSPLHNGVQYDGNTFWDYVKGTITYNRDGTIYTAGSMNEERTSTTYITGMALLNEKTSSPAYNYICSTSSSLSDLKSFMISSRGYIRQVNSSNTPSVTDCLTGINTGFGPQITSVDYYNIAVSRSNLQQVSDGTHNYYANTNIDFSFTDYFANNISQNADLYYTLIIDDLDYSFIPISKATNGYTNNHITLDIGSANNSLLSNINGGLTLVLWYQLPGGSRSGETSYKFYVNANNTATGTSSSGSDNYVTVTGSDNNLPVNITNVIQYDDNLNNSGVNYGDSSEIDFSDGDMRSRFSAMFDFFSIAFSWLPAEIITMVKAGFAIAVVFLIYKIIRG